MSRIPYVVTGQQCKVSNEPAIKVVMHETCYGNDPNTVYTHIHTKINVEAKERAGELSPDKKAIN